MQGWQVYWTNFKSVTSQKTLQVIFREFNLKEAVRDTLTRVPPFDVGQFTHIKGIVSLGCFFCAVSRKMTPLAGIFSALRLCLHDQWAVGTRFVCQLQAHGSNSRYSRGNNSYQVSAPAPLTQSPLTGRFHPDSLSHFHAILLLLYHILIKRAKVWPDLALLPMRGNQLTAHHFSSSFCGTMSQISTPFWHLSHLSRATAYQSGWRTFITFPK